MNPSSTSSSDSSDHGKPALKRFLRSLSVFAIPLIIVMGTFQAWLYQYGENWTLEHIRAYEVSVLSTGEETLFHRIIVPEEMRRYKLGEVLERQPTYVVAGSSTSMQFRNFMFGTCSDQFYNAGGLTNSVDELLELTTILDQSPNTKVLLVGLDQWWFNPNWTPPKSIPLYELPGEARLDLEANLLVFKQLVRAVRDRVRLQSIQTAINTEAPARHNPIGFGGRNGDGFRGSDGSRRYGWLGARAENDWEFRDISNTLTRIELGRDRFEFANAPSEKRMETLRLFLREAKDRGTLVLGYNPPLEPSVREALLSSPKHQLFYTRYLAETKAIFEAAGHPFVAGDDPSSFGLTARNMVDGFHGGELVFAHILHTFAHDEALTETLGGCQINASKLADRAVSPISIR